MVETNRTYVGHRYVPKIIGEWTNTIQYEGLSIVTNQGDSYTSKKMTPIGISLSNEEYWVVTGNYNAQIENYRQEVRDVEKDIVIFKGDVNTQLDKVTTLVTNYSSSNDTNANDMIERAIESTPKFKNILLPKGEYLTVRPIIIPIGVGFQGVGGQTVIKPDFSKWEGTDYRAVIIQGQEGINQLNYAYNNIIGNFTISGLNNTLIKSTGIFIGTDKLINYNESVNYGYINSIIENIMIEKMDTGFYIKECWNSDLLNLQTMFCRRGIVIEGKTVNVNILCKLVNFSTDFTSDKTTTTGILIESKLDYVNGEGRPEGLVIKEGSLIFGADNNINARRSLQLTINKCIIDGAKKESIIVVGGDGTLITGCYVYTSSKTLPAIDFVDLGTGTSLVTVEKCKIVGKEGLKGIQLNNRKNINIINNDISGFNEPIWANNISQCKILNNHGGTNGGIFIYIQSGGAKTIVDGNVTDDDFAILKLHSTTSKELIIGKNTSLNSATYKIGKVIIPAQTSNVTVDSFGVIDNSINQILAIPFFHVNFNKESFVKVRQLAGNIEFSLDDLQSTDTIIYYEIKAVPYSAFY